MVSRGLETLGARHVPVWVEGRGVVEVVFALVHGVGAGDDGGAGGDFVAFEDVVLGCDVGYRVVQWSSPAQHLHHTSQVVLLQNNQQYHSHLHQTRV